ncbi:MAG: MBL fold metallo-hydrolase, partial [Planctomycetota bacterium]
HGVDDLRAFALRMRRRVPVYMDPGVWETMHTRFGYCFVTPPGSSYPPILDARRFEVTDTLSIEGAGGPIDIEPIVVNHGDIDALCLRFGNVAYMPDVKEISEGAAKRLSGLDTLVIDALRDTPHPSHFSVHDALTWIERLAPKRSVLTNLHIDLDHQALAERTPANVEVAYDGLTLISS